MNIKQIILALLALALLGGVTAYYLQKKAHAPLATPTAAINTRPAAIASEVTVAKYVSANIATISPVKSDKTLYVTKTQISQGKGTVVYGNGSTTYTADFTYHIDASGNVTLPTFTLKK